MPRTPLDPQGSNGEGLDNIPLDEFDDELQASDADRLTAQGRAAKTSSWIRNSFLHIGSAESLPLQDSPIKSPYADDVKFSQFIDDNEISAIRAGLDEALGQDGQGSWLALDDSHKAREERNSVDDQPDRTNILDPDITASDYAFGPSHFLGTSTNDGKAAEEGSSFFSRGKNRSASSRSASPGRASFQNTVHAFSSRIVDDGTSGNEDERSDDDQKSYKDFSTVAPPQYPDSAYITDAESSIMTYPVNGSEDEPLERRNAADRSVLCGNSLKMFPPSSPVRIALHKLLHAWWVSPFILLIIFFHLILLCQQNISNIYPDLSVEVTYAPVSLFPRWGQTWFDYAYLVIFSLYTIEIVCKVIVFNLWDDSQDYRHDHSFSWRARAKRALNFKNSAAPTTAVSLTKEANPAPLYNVFQSLVSKNRKSGAHIGERAFLRSSWNRVDFVAVCAYWISLLLSINNFQNRTGFFVFKAISCLRIFRFLAISSDTSKILRGLKQSGPYIIDTFLFIGFFWVLFAFIGVQSFGSSLRRTCIWVDPHGVEQNFSTGKYCGSHYDANTLKKMPFVYENGLPGPVAKGYTCPPNSFCVSGENPYDGTVSFDNIFNSLELTFVVMSVNTFTDIMYDTMKTDYLVSCLFYIFGALILGYWLSNLLIAVVATEFRSVRRKHSKETWRTARMKSWFDSEKAKNMLLRTKFGRAYYACRWIWLLFIAADLIVSCTVSSHSSDNHIQFAYEWHIVTAVALGVEIIVRFKCYLPFWRDFFRSKSNDVDLTLAIINVFIILPFVYKRNQLYQWLTFFQIARFYRIAIAVPSIRILWSKVLSLSRTLLSVAAFLFILNLFASILASSLLRGVMPVTEDIESLSLFDLGSSYLAMYTVTTTENWTAILYASIQTAASRFAAAFYAALFILWFMLSNYVVMNLFIGVINESLEMPDEAKRKAQIGSFISRNILSDNLQVSGGMKFLKNLVKGKLPRVASQDKMVPESSQGVLDMLLEKRVIQEFLDESEEEKRHGGHNDYGGFENMKWLRNSVGRIIHYFRHSENPFNRKLGIHDATQLTDDFLNIRSETLELKRQYLQSNEKYNNALYIFRPYNPVRLFCQKIVASSYGERIQGHNPRPAVWYAYSVFMLAATFGMVVCTCINTPIYFVEMSKKGISNVNWIFWADGTFLCLFSFEFIIKVIADGLAFTPNGYMRSAWNVIDFIVLITLWITFCSEVFFSSYLSHYIRALQAFRALRLLGISRRAQRTFSDVVLSGFWKIVGAGLVSLSLLFPFSLWGLNLFRGRLHNCTDEDVTMFSECIDEYMSTPFNWEILAPRAVTGTYYDFDTIAHSFRIQFEVISLEGWVDVLQSVMSITGTDSNPRPGADPFNGLFPVLYNIVGSIFILTLFVSVIIKNYAESRGTAYLTDEQQGWYELKKRLEMIQPTRIPVKVYPGTLRYRLQKKVLQQRSILTLMEWFVLCGTAILLLSDYSPAPPISKLILRALYLALSFAYLIVLSVRLYALGWRHFFQMYWNIYAFIEQTAAFLLTLIGTVGRFGHEADVFYNFQKLCMVGSLLLFIPKSRRLNLLFSAATASMVEIGNLLITWFILYLVYAIAFNQVFGLTRFGPNGTDSVLNFRTVPKALIVLFRMSCGEGWNEILEDFLVEAPYCVPAEQFQSTDCGNHPSAYILFMSWNLLSMYIFCNLFVSLIYENFSYILHSSVVDITDRDIEEFRQSWSKFDPTGTGYIRKHDLQKVLRSCKGYFHFGIYEDKYSVPEILTRSMARGGSPYDVDISAINEELKDMPVEKCRKQRLQYERFCEQAMLQAHPQKGIAFKDLIIQFPLYKGLESSRRLTLEDYLKDKLLIRKVNEELQKKKIIGYMQVISAQKRLDEYLTSKQAIRLNSNNPFRNAVPTIKLSAVHDDNNDIELQDDRGRTSSVAAHYGHSAKTTSPRRPTSKSLESP